MVLLLRENRRDQNDLTEDIRIDAFHDRRISAAPLPLQGGARSSCQPERWGVMDFPRCLDEKALRRYIRMIPEACKAGGRYTLGSGNSIANHIRLED